MNFTVKDMDFGCLDKVGMEELQAVKEIAELKEIVSSIAGCGNGPLVCRERAKLLQQIAMLEAGVR